MVIPKDALIPESKIRDYLLIPLRKSDKSKYLSLAGYNREDYWELIRDIRQQLLPAEGTFEERKPDGELYRAIGELTAQTDERLGSKLFGFENGLVSGDLLHYFQTENRKDEIRIIH